MPCGCATSCGCEIIAGAGISIKTLGNKVFVSASSALGVATYVQTDDPGDTGSSYVWYEVDGGGALIDTHVVVAP